MSTHSFQPTGGGGGRYEVISLPAEPPEPPYKATFTSQGGLELSARIKNRQDYDDLMLMMKALEGLFPPNGRGQGGQGG